MMSENIRKNPWLGLESYKEGEVLYGRDDDIRDLSQCVLNDIDTLLYGKSGIGKSSILNAGIIPTARRHGFLPIMIRLSHKDEISYLSQITEFIENAFEPIELDEDGNQIDLTEEERQKRNVLLSKRIYQVLPPKDKDKETLYEYFHRHKFYSETGERLKLLIIFDQFEEIFSLQINEKKKKKFFTEFADLLNDVVPSYLQEDAVPLVAVQEELSLNSKDDVSELFESLNLDSFNDMPEYVRDNEIHYVFTIREDFLSEFEYYSASIPSLKQNRYGLRPINEEQASQIILRPRPGLIALDVAQLIIQKVTGRQDFLIDGTPELDVDSAVLSLYLNRLYDAKDGDIITHELVEQKGGEIINDFYADAISEISESTIEYLENRLLNGQNRRDNITIYDAINEGNISEEELDILCNKKKILRQFNYAGDLRIEYVHDILCPVVKEHKEERILLKQQEEERKQQEAEKRRIILAEQKKREELERKAEEEKAQMLYIAMKKQKRRNRYIIAISIVLLFMLSLMYAYYWMYRVEIVSYYAQFERVHGWPRGVGKPLSAYERSHTPIYYRLSRNGNLKHHDTDVKIMSSNKKLPLTPRISVPELYIDDVSKNDEKAMAYYDLLTQVVSIHFVGNEDDKIDKEILKDKNDSILYVVNYYHLPNEKEAWLQYVTSTGHALQFSDRGADRIKLLWHKNNLRKDNNGRIESTMYFDAQENSVTTTKNIGGYKIWYKGEDVIYQLALDEYGRANQESTNDYNMTISRYTNDTVDIKYMNAYHVDTINLFPAGDYVRSLSVKVDKDREITYLYENGTSLYSVEREKIKDKCGNLIECHDRQVRGTRIPETPASILYSYSNDGYMTKIEKLDERGKPFVTASDSIYKKCWEYDANGNIIKEVYWNGKNEKIFSSIVTEVLEDNFKVRTKTIEDKRINKYLVCVDSIYSDSVIITSYYANNGKPCKYKSKEKIDSIEYHKVVVKNIGDKKLTYYYTIDINGSIVPLPMELDEYGRAKSFYCKEQCYNEDGNELYYRLFDVDGSIIKSMMYYYLNGTIIAQAVMGVDGYGHPVRCSDWEEEGYAYYKLHYKIDVDGNFKSVEAVDEWNNSSIYYDSYDHSYEKIEYINFKGNLMLYGNDTIKIENMYCQNVFNEDDISKEIVVPYLHILDKESLLYIHGFRDGDRIIRLGKWKLGNSEILLQKEWNRSKKDSIMITVLRPNVGILVSYDRIEKRIKRDGVSREKEAYYIYALTEEESRILKNKIELQ